MKKDYKEDVLYISFASVISAIAVVYLHVNECFWKYNDAVGYWYSANIIECLAYFAVPVFFMISGATLIDFFERYDLKVYVEKRIRKTVIPYVFWSLFGLIFQIWVVKSLPASELNLKNIIRGFLSGRILGIFWFFNPLFCIYLTIPLFAAVEKQKRKMVFTLVVAATLVINYAIPFMITLCGINGINIPYSFHMDIGSGYLIYVLLGYLLTHHEIPKTGRWCIYFCGIIGLMFHLIGTWYYSTEAGEIISTFKGYTKTPCLMYSVAVFIAIRYGGSILLKNRRFNAVVSFMAGYTFSIYLLHWFIKELILKLPFIDKYSLLYRLTAPLVIVMLAIILARVARKIPLIKRVLP